MTAHAWGLVGLALAVCAAPGSEVQVTIVDPQRSGVHAPGAKFQVQVTLEGPDSAGATTFAQWVGPQGNALAPRFELATGTHTLTSPQSSIGYYGLVFTNSDSRVAFPPQDPGFPSSEYGFAILPARAPARELEADSLFGMVHGDRNDPYLAGGLKTLTWNTTGAAWWAEEIEQRLAANLIELPLVSGKGWDCDDDLPISAWRLDALEAKFRGYLRADRSLRAWELGVEENLGSTYGQPYYFENLAAKAARVRKVAHELGAEIELVYQFEGFDYAELEQLFRSGATRDFSVLSLHPYKWKAFPDPEEWFGNHVDEVRSRMAKHGRADMRVWITELGLPVRGTTNPSAFFGYPAKDRQVPGATREHQARYLVKAHVLAAERGVDKVFTYNYQNRGGDVHYAEHHFGLRSYTGSKHIPGHPLPSYVAYANMVMQLDGKCFTRAGHPRKGVWVREFSSEDVACIVAWVHPEGRHDVELSELREGLSAADVLGVSDMYGTPAHLLADTVTLSGRPVFVSIRRR